MMVMVVEVVMLLTVVQVVVEHQVAMFMILLLVDGLSLLEVAVEEVEVLGTSLEMLVQMEETGSQ